MNAKNSSNKINFTLNCKGKKQEFTQPLVMGIINITPDSFYAGSRFTDLDAILSRIEQMQREGAAIVDIGAQSTRPGSTLLSWQEEWDRLKEPLTEIRKVFPGFIISVDTFYPAVAEKSVQAGADLINDISGSQFDKEMIAMVGQLQVPYICMHSKGTPQLMQENPVYKNIADEILDYFSEKISLCKQAGIKDIILDPGFGFGKTIAHNFTLLHQLPVFIEKLGLPLLVGVSRKSMIYKTLQTTAAESLNGTTALHAIALQNGASILRVHDVKEAVEVVQLVQALQNKG